jgi:hypothetical protein
MSSTLGFIRHTTVSLVLSVATLALASGEANAQSPGYGWDYDYPVTGFNYGAGGFDYGLSAFGFPNYGSSGNGVGPAFYGASGFDYGLGAFGFPPYGTSGYGGYSVGPAFGGGGTVNGLSYMGALFGSGTTVVGNQGFANGSNRSGRVQAGADRRAKTRRLQQQRGGGL